MSYPSTRGNVARTSDPSSRNTVDDGTFGLLRLRADALHDLVEAGRRPTLATMDALIGQLVTFRRASDGPEIRQMIDDARELRRRVVTMSRRPVPPRIGSSRTGRGFWEQPTGESAPPRRRRSTPRRSPARVPVPHHDATEDPHRVRVIAEAHALRDRADRFAAARSAGRTFPVQETRRLFLHFKVLRPQLDAETKALNDAAVLRLVEAFGLAGRALDTES